MAISVMDNVQLQSTRPQPDENDTQEIAARNSVETLRAGLAAASFVFVFADLAK